MDSRVRALYKIEAQPKGPTQARRIIAEELSTLLSPTTRDPGSPRGFARIRAAVGDCGSSSSSRTGGEWSVRHGEPKCGSNAIADEVVPRGLRPRASLQLG